MAILSKVGILGCVIKYRVIVTPLLDMSKLFVNTLICKLFKCLTLFLNKQTFH